MPLRSSILSLPESVRSALDEKIRAGLYGDARPLVAWIKGQGHEVSKSALGRYALKLRARDAAAGNDVAELLDGARSARRSSKQPRAEAKDATADDPAAALAEASADLSQLAVELGRAARRAGQIARAFKQARKP